MSWTAVIPTKGERHDYLAAMLDVLGARNAIVVHTDPSSKHLAGATNIDDYGPVNIQRWWNAGIAASPDDYVAVLNDDLSIDHLTVPALAHALHRTGATLAHHGDTDGHVKELPSRNPTPINGWCWMVNRTHGILPDERFRWWWGDRDIARRAYTDGNGVALVSLAGPTHKHPGEYTRGSDKLRALADADRKTYERMYGGR